MSDKYKEMLGAKIKVIYEVNEHVKTVTGRCVGCNLLFSEDTYFLVVNKEDGVDRLIPVNKIGHIDILNAEEIELKKEETIYHG